MKSQILTFWNFYRTQVRSLPWKSFYYLIPILNFALNVGFVKVLTWTSTGHMDLPKLIYGFSCYMDLPNYYMYYCFVDFSKFFLCNPSPLPNKIKLKCDQDFKACWSFCFELKVLNELKHSMHWVRCAFGKKFSLFFRLFFKQWSPPSTTVARSFSTASPLLNK